MGYFGGWSIKPELGYGNAFGPQFELPIVQMQVIASPGIQPSKPSLYCLEAMDAIP